jgi:hypothetical protein
MKPIAFRGFETLNTLAARPSIEDEHCSWMDGFMPIGKSTARTMPGIGTPIFGSPDDVPVVFFAFASVGDVPYCIIFLSTGDIWVVNQNTGNPSLIATALIASASQLNIGVSQWGNQFIVIVASAQPSGNGLFLWDGTTLYLPGDSLPGYTTVATGIQGSGVESFQGRIWIVNGASVYFSAPQDPGDYSTMDGGGAFTSFDAFLRALYVRPIQSSGFLYLIADSSINYISQVVTAGDPSTTTFSNQNADPEIGTPYPNTVMTYSRNIMFGNSFGVHQLSGGAVSKVSDVIDGTWDSVGLNFNGAVLSSCKAIVYGRRIYASLVSVINPTNGQEQTKLICWDGKRWWTSPQEIIMTFVTYWEFNSVITAFGTNGIAIYPLFETPSATLPKVIQSKLFPGEGGPMLQKAASRLWGSVIYNSTLSPGITVTIDSETQSASQDVNLSPNPVTWINSATADDDISWVNSDIPGAVTWGGASIGIVVFPPMAIAQNGTMLGLTLYTFCADLTLLEMVLGTVVTQYRG